MSRRMLVTIMLAVFVLATAAFSFGANGKSINWVTNFDQASKTAKSANKPMMVDFFTTWCGWCKKLDSDTYTNAKVVDMSSKFVPVKLDGEKNSALARKYRVSGFPTIVFLNSQGKEVSRVVGFQSADQFAKSMQDALNKAK